MINKKHHITDAQTMKITTNRLDRHTEFLVRSVKKLKSSNRRLKVLCVVAIGCAIYTAVESRKQEEEIYRLSIRVKRLEHREKE